MSGGAGPPWGGLGPLARVHGLIAAEPLGSDPAAGTAGWLQRLCRAAVGDLSVTGAALCLVDDEGLAGVGACSDAASGLVEELQVTLGEGPGPQAYAIYRPVLVSGLDAAAMARWPGYGPAVHARGVRAVFAFPLQVGAARLGWFDLYRDRPGALGGQGVGRAVVFAEVATMALIEGQESAEQGRLPAGLDDAMSHQHELHQAQGMVMIMLGCTLAEAMVRLRAHAFTSNRPLSQVARDVLARKLHLDRDGS